MKQLLITGACSFNEEQRIKLKELGFNLTFMQDETSPIEIEVSNVDAVICNSLFLYHDIELFKELKLIQLTSAGMDRVPLDYIQSKNIEVFNARGVYSVPVAEWVVLKILELYKNLLTSLYCIIKILLLKLHVRKCVLL